MKYKFIWICLIIMLSGLYFNNVNCVIDKDISYHETNFTTNEWFDVLQDVILNTTTNTLYLNGSTTYLYEDFDTFTESDSSNKLSHTQYKSSFTSLDRTDIDTFLYKSKTNELQSFIYLFDIFIDAIGNNAVDYRANMITINEVLDDETGTRTGNYESFGTMIRGTTTTAYGFICLYETYNGALYLTSVIQLNTDTEYYGKITKVGTALSLEVYSDSLYTTQVGSTINLILHGNWNLQYLMCPQSLGRSTSVTITGYIENLRRLSAGYEAVGYAYTKNLLENETDIAFSSLVNATIGTGCNLKVYFSDDNTTWIERLYLTTTGIDYTKLENLNYTSLYVKFKLSSNGFNNVEVLNFFYTNVFVPLEGESKPNYALWIILITCVPTMLLILYKVKRK